MKLTLGISTCPNDTFLFHGLLSGAIEAEGLELSFDLLDIEALNEGLLAGRFDVAKGSFALFLDRAEELLLLPIGSALGSGNGPLLLAAREGLCAGQGRRILAPGRHTTATLLLELFHGPALREARLEQVPFFEIQPALLSGRADLGACIHEGRFTWKEQGLFLVEDLGQRWEQETGALLPLGGLFARKRLPGPVLAALCQALERSLLYARAHPGLALATMRAHAQELSDEVLLAHVDLYVNEETAALSSRGQAAIEVLARLARERGLLGKGTSGLEVFDRSPATHWHICAPEAAERLSRGESLLPESLRREGFVHLSERDQIEGTLRAHFAGGGPLALLELGLPRGAPLVEEPSRGGQLFPHLFRALHPSDLRACHAIVTDGGAGHLVPPLGTGP